MGKARVISNNCNIIIEGDFGPNHLDYFCSAFWDADDARGDAGCVSFDFSGCERAFPNSMVPVCAAACWLRHQGADTRIVLPRTQWLAKHFVQVDWAHLIDPSTYGKSGEFDSRHLAASIFATDEERRLLINACVSLLLKSGDIVGKELNALKWSLVEITGNIFEHSQSPVGGVMQLEFMKGKIAIAVADCGIGILRTLRQSYPALRSDAEAVQHATRMGVTRDPAIGQGNGLSGSLRLASAFKGRFALYSCQGGFVTHKDLPEKLIDLRDPFPGTFLDIQFERGLDPDIDTAISGKPDSGYEVWDIISEEYTDSEGQIFVVNIASETDGLGSRHAGKQCRTLCENLLRDDPQKRLCVDWSGVPVLASSFVDEFVGKMCLNMGPTGFFSRVTFRGMEPLVRRIVDSVISQRLASSFER